MKITPIFLILFIFLVGCATTPQKKYYWGEYDNLVLDYFNKDNDYNPQAHAAKIEDCINKANSNEKEVPPGMFVHLGYLQYLSGNNSDAINSLNKEKKLYPESATFVDRLMVSLGARSQVKARKQQ